ncbi:hypothetical protein F5Y14DRAFT_416993 [Nemania sp. NC0429]|nr:hypothetical protein F5Y14DRAFT_416993 [Nemania sp. NC0429]
MGVSSMQVRSRLTSSRTPRSYAVGFYLTCPSALVAHSLPGGNQSYEVITTVSVFCCDILNGTIGRAFHFPIVGAIVGATLTSINYHGTRR